MNKVRRDAVRHYLRRRHWRLALTALVMPKGWALENKIIDPTPLDEYALAGLRSMPIDLHDDSPEQP